MKTGPPFRDIGVPSSMLLPCHQFAASTNTSLTDALIEDRMPTDPARVPVSRSLLVVGRADDKYKATYHKQL